jgi:hypothetical protein
MGSLGNRKKTSLLGSVLPPKQISPIRVAKATDETGDVVCSVSYTKIENYLLITSFSISPFASVEEAQHAGDAIDKQLEDEAAALGVSSLLIMVPGQDRCEEVRTYRNISQNPTSLMGVGCYTPSPAAKYLN